MVRVIVAIVAALILGCLVGAAPPLTAGDTNHTAINLEALSRLKGMDLEANPALKAVVLRLLDQTRGTAQFVEIVREFKLKGQDAALIEMAARNPSKPEG